MEEDLRGLEVIEQELQIKNELIEQPKLKKSFSECIRLQEK